MKNKSLILVSLSLAIWSSYSFAGGDSEGTSASCMGAEYSCASKNDRIKVCQYEDKTVVEVTRNGSSAVSFYPSKEVSNPNGIEGAPTKFIGPKVSLEIETDTAPAPQGQPGYLTVDSLGLHAKLRCKSQE